MDLLNLTLNKDTNYLRAHVKDGEIEVIVEEWQHGYAMLPIGGELTPEQSKHLNTAMAATRIALDEENKALGDSSRIDLTDEQKPLDSAPSS